VILFCGWLGGYNVEGSGSAPGRLLTIEEVGAVINGRNHTLKPYSIQANESVKQSPSISKTATPSTSQSKNTSKP
jgi:hypothetical protein